MAIRQIEEAVLDHDTVERLSTAFNRCFETFEAGDGTFSPDAFFDLLPPMWRFQLQGGERVRRAARRHRRRRGRP